MPALHLNALHRLRNKLKQFHFFLSQRLLINNLLIMESFQFTHGERKFHPDERIEYVE